MINTLILVVPVIVTATKMFDWIASHENPLLRPSEKVSIVMPTFNEERYIKMSLESLKNQTIVSRFPESFEIIVADGISEDSTPDIANEYARVIQVKEKGILTARAVCIKESRGQIIVSVNADTYYPKTWLQNVLYHFKYPEVVGVTTPRLYFMEYDGKVSEHPANIPMKLWRPVERYMYGSNSAFLKDAYYITGGFNLNVNQLNSEELQPEEEIYFRDRLQKVGKVVFEYSPVFTAFRRVGKCWFNPKDTFCREIEEGRRFRGIRNE